MENNNSKSTLTKNNAVMKKGLSSHKASSVYELTITALAIALVYIFTTAVHIQLPIPAAGGLIHLGNVPLFIFAILYGKKTGAICGGVGMALSDLLTGWTMWAGFTLVIVAAMGYAVGKITEKKKTLPRYLLAFFAALIIKLVGYYFAEVIIYGNWITPFASIWGNIIQITVAVIIVLLVIKPLQIAVGKIKVD